jgi:hypothetical protein
MMMDQASGMSGVTVKRMELLQVLMANREAHREVFLEAQEGYREEAIKEIDRMLEDARKTKIVRRSITLIEPQDHTKDYDRAIRMLEMCVQENVFISESEFAMFVQDDWDWKKQFVGSTSNYLNYKR